MKFLIQMKKMKPENIKLRSIGASDIWEAKWRSIAIILAHCDIDKSSYKIKVVLDEATRLHFFLCFKQRKQLIKISAQE